MTHLYCTDLIGEGIPLLVTDSGEEAGTQVQPARSNARGANTGADLQEVSQRRPQDEPTITQTTASARAAPAAILEEEAVSPASAAQPQQQQQPLPVQQQLPPTKGSFKIKFIVSIWIRIFCFLYHN